MISVFSLTSCSLRHVPATKLAKAADEVLVAAPAEARMADACLDAAAYRRMALGFRKPRPGQDPALLEPLSADVPALEPTRCGVLKSSGPGDKYDFALAEYRVPGDEGADRYFQVVRADKRRGRRSLAYFRRFSGDLDSRTAVKAVCDFDGDGFPDVALDVCGEGGCGASVLLLKPETGDLELREIAPPEDRP
jgi:hypothetical protein